MKWEACFGFFWYNDEEIFKFTEEDFEKKAARFAEAGINIVITFSCTHFRWTMRPYWKLINNTLKKVVEACHKYGILVVEHHSSHLTFDPLNEEDWGYMERILNKRGSSINSWKGILDYINSDPKINGYTLSTFRQIDGRTGKWARTGYHGYGMCFNNPNYRKEYFAYLEEVYNTGIDGIMTDDVQWFGGTHGRFNETHACTCQYCRELFQDQTGYELPEPGEDWNRFYGDYENQIFLAWKKFKCDSIVNFHKEVNSHFKSLGREMLRPYYVSDVLYSNPTAYAFDSIVQLLDWIFQENTFSSIIRYSWPMFAMEAAHRYALASRYNIPSMSMFYPDRVDNFYFTWALAKSWGQLYLATPEGHDLTDIEKKYRDFEKQHKDLLKNQIKKAEIAFYFSLKTRDLVKDSARINMSSLVRWMQSAYFTNKCFDMVFENDMLSKLKEYPLIVLANVSMLSDEEYSKLIEYVASGGKLLITGIPGERDIDGRKRSQEEICRNLNINVFPTRLEKDISKETLLNIDNNIIQVAESVYTHVFNNTEQAEVILRTTCGMPVGIRFRIGIGSIIWITSCEGLNPVQDKIVSDRFKKEEECNYALYYAIYEMRSGLGRILGEIIGESVINTKDCPEDWIVTYFTDELNTGSIIHIVNTKGTLIKEESASVSHDDPIPAFNKTYTCEGEFISKLMLKGFGSKKIKHVKLHTPESSNNTELLWSITGDYLSIDIPSCLFKGYAIIDIKNL